MNVDVRCYGEVAAAVGETDVSLSLDADATVGDVVAELAVGERAFSGGLVVMVNGRHADDGDGLDDGDTVALSQAPMRE
ncbi:MoaD/ThiS family protein [Haloplanus litoreus]|uniref:MoaD/ThiS family protein n=1 Tax=Haloplanus litoreus TaxID=767515 RepID=A0ABD6A1Q1_9EURY